MTDNSYLVLSGKIIKRFLFLRLSSPGSPWCDALALCLQVAAQVPQHYGSSRIQAACDGRFAFQSVCMVVSSDSASKQIHESLRRRVSNTVTGQDCLERVSNGFLTRSHSTKMIDYDQYVGFNGIVINKIYAL